MEINPVIGSILVRYASESPAEIHKLLESAGHPVTPFDARPVLTEADEIAMRIEKAEFLAAHSETVLHIVNAMKSLNTAIREATGNTLDLKVLLPAGLAVWAFFKAGPEVSAPLWVTLGIMYSILSWRFTIRRRFTSRTT